ncbi:MAG: RidA family protein [Chloroflexi bacterium]|uniref:RidA family protein n=1 Tax=Candidatus Chlorohelix allophototropha TaxID=3003348 RepID=A0A8T7M2D3_9CHLR|nr:RidA family protein [Chloroflexota bacterium]WJW65519.1 RidA family protein [Chloroflexota bacterium L227-S17]
MIDKLPPEARFINPSGLSKPLGYSHVVEVLSGRPVYISGQVPVNWNGELVGGSNFALQAHQVFNNLRVALESVGATFNEVVKLNIYLLYMSHLAILRDIRNQYINMEKPPAITTIEITKLASPSFMIEIEAIALLPN